MWKFHPLDSTFYIIFLTASLVITLSVFMVRVYTTRWLPLHVAATWVFGFVFLVPTSLSMWGQFGLDLSVGSCTIILDEHGRSAKEFLFVFAFLSPCLAIIVCYARLVSTIRQLTDGSSLSLTLSLVSGYFSSLIKLLRSQARRKK